MSRNIAKILSVTGSLISYFSLTGKAFAIDLGSIAPDIGFKTLDEFIQNALTVAVSVAAVIAVIFMIVNGINYITSAGDATKTEQAQKGIIAALIGLIVVGIAYLLVRFVVVSILKQPDLEGLDTLLFFS